ncbi:MAG TPA: DUF374 domain-containing protein [Gemmataceae bacterium]|jgi:hypothetical protein|nr:DUF374 domain-containing protein [Gemmataceae bacterium]
MAFKHPLMHRSLALLGYGIGIALRSTLDVRIVHADARINPWHPDRYPRAVQVVWHETLLIPVLMLGRPHNLALASASGDGEVIAQFLQHLGWGTARGSSSRGGVAALLRFLNDDVRSPNLAVDGPRGPRRVMSPGAVFLASKLGLPIACAGVGLDRPWRLRSWDKFAIPRPYSRARIVTGPLRHVPTGLDREGLEAYRAWFQDQLNWLTMEAESWAESGRRRIGELPVSAIEMSPPLPYWDPAHAVRMPESLERAWTALPKGAARERAA